MTETDHIRQPRAWAKFKAIAKKVAPSRAVRWTTIYVPLFCALLLFALRVASKGNDNAFSDLSAYVMEVGTRSVPVLIAIAITYGVASGLGWNLDNEDRARWQRVLVGEADGNAWGALMILAGEMVSILALLALLLRALLVWQG